MTGQSKNGWREFVLDAITQECPAYLGRDHIILQALAPMVYETVYRIWARLDIPKDELVIVVPNEGWASETGPEGSLLGIRLISADIDWPVVGVEVVRRV